MIEEIRRADDAPARRLSKALFELAKEAGEVAQVAGELNSMGELLEGNPELHDVLFRPLHPAAQRRAVLDGVNEQLGASAAVRSFFSLLIDQRRLVDFPAIREEFERRASEDAGYLTIKGETSGATRAEVAVPGPVQSSYTVASSAITNTLSYCSAETTFCR